MEKMVHQINTDRPFLELASALKSGGGLGSHFNLERHSDEKVAAATIDLIECLVNYIYVFRSRLNDLVEMVRPGADEVIDVSLRPDDFQGSGFSNGNGNGNGAHHRNGGGATDTNGNGIGNGNSNGFGNGNGAPHGDPFSAESSNEETDEEAPALFGHR